MSEPIKLISCELKTGDPALLCVRWDCPNCGAGQVVNVDSQAHARQECSWCPVCDDDCDPQPLVEHYRFALLPKESAP